MCTVSIIPIRRAAQRGGSPVRGYRLVTNRDEQRDRPAAAPPRWHRLGDEGVEALYPTDGQAGGTWVGVTRAGLTLCLLNGNPRPYPPLPPRDRLVSRGAIIPSLIAHESKSPQVIASAVEEMELDAFAPFTLLAVGVSAGAVRLTWDRVRLARCEFASGPVCAVSSGLGDDVVRPRLPLFEALMGEFGARTSVQDHFHRHTWPDRPEISVMMRRGDARTVSVTTVEVAAVEHGPLRVDMRYEAVGSHNAPAEGEAEDTGLVSSRPRFRHASASTVSPW